MSDWKWIIIILCLAFLVFPSKAETRVFDIKLAGINIGKIYAVHESHDDNEYYSITGTVELNIFFKIKIKYQTLSVYKNNKLVESIVKSNVNGTEYSSSTKWSCNKYIINCNAYNYQYSDSTQTLPIDYSVSKLYFNKPFPDRKIYAETYGLLGGIRRLDNGTLKFEIPKGKIIFQYDELGNLMKVEMINPIKNFEITKAKN